MMRFKDTVWWKVLKVVLEILLIVGIVWGAVALYTSLGFASADVMYEEAYVICTDEVHIRREPSRKSASIGRFECGDVVLLDGKQRNGYLHCVDLSLEEDSGWIHKGYVVYDKPEKMNCTATVVSKGKLRARKNVGGKTTRMLQPQATLKVYCWSDEWCVTNCGYVQSRFLEIGGD